jgi:hypothetical protein
VVSGLVQALASGEPRIRDNYLRGKGLCLRHVRLALLLRSSGETVDDLARHFLSGLRRLLDELAGGRSDAAGTGPALDSASPQWTRLAERFVGTLP